MGTPFVPGMLCEHCIDDREETGKALALGGSALRNEFMFTFDIARSLI